MAITVQDVRPYSVASVADSDASSPFGGAINLTRTVAFIDAPGALQGVSSDAADVGNFTLAAFGLDSNGNEVIDSIAPLGQTPTPFAVSFVQLLQGQINAGTAFGDVAIESQTPARTGTAQSGASTSIVLDAGASAVDAFFASMIVRITGGTGAGQIRQIISYSGTTKTAVVDRAWGVNPDNTSTFNIAVGFYFALAPNQIQRVRRLFYHAVGPSAADPTKTFYDKFFFRNDAGTGTMVGTFVTMDDPTGAFVFGLSPAINDATITLDRKTAPAGVTFGTASASVPGGSLAPGDRIGVWVKVIRLPGATAIFDARVKFSIGWNP